jgi:predicted AAA+ superfamily ATPase
MYIERLIEKQVRQHLSREELSIICGVRQSGKTMFLKYLQQEMEKEQHICYFINLENQRFLRKLNEDPANIFEIVGTLHGKKIVIFMDEIQNLKDSAQFFKLMYDEYRSIIKFVVSAPYSFLADEKFNQALIGRKKCFCLGLLNFKEFLNFKQSEVAALFSREKHMAETRELPLIHADSLKILMNEFVSFGAYPAVVLETEEKDKIDLLTELYQSYFAKNKEFESIRNKSQFFQVMQLMAEKTGQVINTNELAVLVGVSVTALENYLKILENSAMINRVRPFFCKNKKELNKMPKIYFKDTGLRNTLLNDFNLMDDRLDREQYFENIVFKLLDDHQETKKINYWRTQAKHEVDFIINESLALEAKYSAKSFKEKKYDQFRKFYPDIPLYPVCYKDHNGSGLTVFDLI